MKRILFFFPLIVSLSFLLIGVLSLNTSLSSTLNLKKSSVFALPFKVKDDDGELKDKRGSPPLPFSASVTSRAGNPRSSD